MGFVPQSWKDASIVTEQTVGLIEESLSFHRRQDFRQDPHQIIYPHTPEVVPETPYGFTGYRSAVDIIFRLRQLQDKCIEQDRPLYMVSLDFSKAFDTVGRTGLWQLLRKKRSSQY